MYIPYFFFFNDTATTEIYTLSLHDALPISHRPAASASAPWRSRIRCTASSIPTSTTSPACGTTARSEEHTSELQSRLHLVCRLLLEKKKKRESSSRVTTMTGFGSQRAVTST